MDMLTLFSRCIRLDPETCLALIKTAPSRYKKFYIPKRKEGKRLIAQPTPAVKALQRIATFEYLLKLPIHAAATAYMKGGGIKKNAQAHVGNRYLLKLDFQNFFNSLLPNDLELLEFKSVCGLTQDEIELLKSLFFWRPSEKNNDLCLSIGAPSSPYLSNNILFNFDSHLHKICLTNNVVYTRYSDDITLSTNRKHILNDIFEEIKLTCLKSTSPSLCLNMGKIVFASKKGKRQVTGVVLANNGKISLGREKKRQIRAMVHKLITDTVADEKFLNQLNGYLAFAYDIEPEFITRLSNSYSEHLGLLQGKGLTVLHPKQLK